LFIQHDLAQNIFGQEIFFLCNSSVKSNNISWKNCEIMSVVVTGNTVFSLSYLDTVGVFNCSFMNVSCISSNDFDSSCLKCDYLRYLNISYCSIRSCRSAKRGGFGLIRNVEVKTNLENSLFVDCFSKWGGVAILINTSQISIISCSFIHCSSSDGCGGLSSVHNDSLITVNSCTFFNCCALNPDTGFGYGGGIEIDYFYRSLITNCSFRQCSALRGVFFYVRMIYIYIYICICI
jgi:hypothetical protein